METQARRLKLHEELCDILGSRNVYYQPPEKGTMKYPCIVYFRAGARKYNADNCKYLYYSTYELTFISKDPDNDVPEALDTHFQTIRRESRYTADGLYHDPFYLYY